MPPLPPLERYNGPFVSGNAVVVYGLPEFVSDPLVSSKLRREYDRYMLEELLSYYALDGQVIDSYRMGIPSTRRPRALKVQFSNSHQSKDFAHCFQQVSLRAAPHYLRYVFIRMARSTPDPTTIPVKDSSSQTPYYSSADDVPAQPARDPDATAPALYIQMDLDDDAMVTEPVLAPPPALAACSTPTRIPHPLPSVFPHPSPIPHYYNQLDVVAGQKRGVSLMETPNRPPPVPVGKRPCSNLSPLTITNSASNQVFCPPQSPAIT